MSDDETHYADCQACDTRKLFDSEDDLLSSDWQIATVRFGGSLTTKMAICPDCDEGDIDTNDAMEALNRGLEAMT